MEDDLKTDAIFNVPASHLKEAKKCINRAYKKWDDNPERDFMNIWWLVEDELKKSKVPYKNMTFETIELSDY